MDTDGSSVHHNNGRRTVPITRRRPKGSYEAISEEIKGSQEETRGTKEGDKQPVMW